MIKKENKTEYISKIAVLPGEILLEAIEEREMTQAELAQRINRPLKTINEIIKGKAAITAETAIQLEQALNIPARFWANLESDYRDVKARLRLEDEIVLEEKNAKDYPYKEMANWGWVEKTSNKLEKTNNLLHFLGVTSFQNIVEDIILGGSLYRISKKRKYSIPAIIAWLRKGIIEGISIQTNKFNEDKLRNSIKDIRGLTIKNPEYFQPKLVEILSASGVALTITQNLKNAPINGVSRWLSSDKALIQLSIRNSYNDIFWFSLFHEIGHLLLHGKKYLNIDFIENRLSEEKEKEADNFAASNLVPPEQYKKIVEVVRGGNFSYDLIRKLANMVGIHPAIIIGRLQHEGILSFSFNKLRVKFCWK